MIKKFLYKRRCGVAFTTKAALDAGATPEEIAGAVGEAVFMSGGPGTAYGGLAIEAMEQFLEEQEIFKLGLIF